MCSDGHQFGARLTTTSANLARREFLAEVIYYNQERPGLGALFTAAAEDATARALAFPRQSDHEPLTEKERYMIDHTLDTANSILYVRPKASLEQGDFAQLAKTVDPYIEKTGGLAGLIIEAQTFPGWENLGAMATHFRFVRDHHKRIRKIGLVTDSVLGTVAEHLASHFVSAEIKRFAAEDLEAAKQWVMT